MFLGHYAVGFASKRFAPRTSLGTLLAAAMFLDILWPVFLALGIERARIDPGNTPTTPLAFDSYPYSHSLAAALFWGAALASITWGVTRYRAGAIAVGCLTVSHWILDAATHKPDLALYPGGPEVGLGLWYSVPATVAVEIVMLAVGVGMYLAATRARDRIGDVGLYAFLALQLAMYAGALFGPPPPSLAVIEATAVLLVPVLLWAAWIDRHRAPA